MMTDWAVMDTSEICAICDIAEQFACKADLLHSLTTQRHACLVTHKCLVTACVLDFLAFLTSVSLQNKLCRLQIIATMIEVTSEE